MEIDILKNYWLDKGVNSGREFWSCSGFPNCKGTLNIK
jgi:ssDNA-binding Zn-finger/Zn-ribbon topoisomerase 1